MTSETPAAGAEPLPSVSAIVIAVDQEPQLRALIASLREQAAGLTLQIVLVDAGSKDGSAALDREFSDVSVLKMRRYFGMARARNMGVRAAQGDYLLFIEPSMSLPVGALARMVSALEQGAGAALQPTSHSQVLRLPSPGDLYQAWRQDGDLSGLATEGGPWVTNCAVLVRKSFIQGMNYFDERYGEFGPELEFFFQLKVSGKPVVILEGAAGGDAVGGWPDQAHDRRDQALLSADFVNGMAVFAAKHGGSGYGVRIKAAFAALVDLLTHPGEIGYRFAILVDILNGQQVDGL